MKDFNHFSGCLLGGAVGDALGGPVEFLSIDGIRRQFGSQGVVDYVGQNRQGLAEFTDDTQMTLFTAEGLLCAAAAGTMDVDGCVEAIYRAYLRWLRTQSREGRSQTRAEGQGRLLQEEGLWKIKAPGNTCLSALYSGKAGIMEQPINNSKGCGGVMRVAPIGLWVQTGSAAFELGSRAAALTHGHPSGYLSAGCLAQLIADLVSGSPFEEAIQHTLTVLAHYSGHEETTAALHKALEFARDPRQPVSPAIVEKIGAGWVGEEALAVAVYATLIGLREQSFRQGVLLAVNHSGDCDSTAAIAGNLLGVILGRDSIPSDWIARLEMHSLIDEIAQDMLVSKGMVSSE